MKQKKAKANRIKQKTTLEINWLKKKAKNSTM